MIDGVADCTDDVVTLDALVTGSCWSLEPHDVGCVKSELRDGRENNSGVGDTARLERLLVTISSVVVGS